MFEFLGWVSSLWNNIFYRLSFLKIEGVPFSSILFAWAFLNLFIFRLIKMHGG